MKRTCSCVNGCVSYPISANENPQNSLQDNRCVVLRILQEARNARSVKPACKTSARPGILGGLNLGSSGSERLSGQIRQSPQSFIEHASIQTVDFTKV